jgi:A/G-specific adenine glycosylase
MVSGTSSVADPSMPTNNFPAIRRTLLRWYDSGHRDLPWRHTQDPYAIWIAETMLQQTQVTTVVPYYERFLKCFPTVDALDRARLRRVLSLWSGLGYYRRAENLKSCARVLAREHGGRLPDNYEKLRTLPGVGAYTAGALMSIAFDKRYAAVDGNVRRVLSRIFQIEGQAPIAEMAERLAPRRRPGDFNQALMELGATICTPGTPRCTACPLARSCRAVRIGTQTAIMRRNHLNLLRKITWPLAILRRNGVILLHRRPARGILAGLWEFPGGEAGTRENIRAVLKTQLAPLQCRLSQPCRIGEFRHAITDRSITAPVFLFELGPAPAFHLPARAWRWFPVDSIPRHPVSSMTLKALNKLAAHDKDPR